MQFDLNIDFENLEKSCPLYSGSVSPNQHTHRMIGKNLVFIKKTKGISASDLANRLQTSVQSIHNWKTGKHALPISKAALLSIEARIPLVFLLRNTPYAEMLNTPNDSVTLAADYLFLKIGGMGDDEYLLHLNVLHALLSCTNIRFKPHGYLDRFDTEDMKRHVRKDYSRIIGNNLRRIRRRHKLTLDQFACLFGITSESYRKWEQGQAGNVAALTIARFAWATKTNPLILIEGCKHHPFRVAMDERLTYIRKICRLSDPDKVFTATERLSSLLENQSVASEKQLFFKLGI